MASELESLVIRRANKVGYDAISKALKCDDSMVSRILSSERGFKINCAQKLLDVLGLRVIELDPEGLVTISRREYDALAELARMYLDMPRAGEKLPSLGVNSVLKVVE